MESIYHILYSSISKGYVTPAFLEDILSVARRNNVYRGVTGLLLCRAGHFIQLLEGDEKAVTAIYEKIAKDTRHQDVKVLTQFTSPSRLFQDWSMGYVKDETQTQETSRRLELLFGKTLVSPGSHGAPIASQVLKTQVIGIFKDINRTALAG